MADRVPVDAETPSYEQLLCSVKNKRKILDEKMMEIEREATLCKQCKEQYHLTLQKYQPMIDAQVDTSNGTEQTVIQQARALIQNAKDIVENQSNKVQMLIQNLTCFMKTDIYNALDNLTSLLVQAVKRWQHEIQLEYAELYAEVDNSFAPYCAQTGQLLREVLRKDIPRLENTVNAIGVQEDIKVLYEQFSSLLVSFYQRTFVVFSQEGLPKRDHSQKHDSSQKQDHAKHDPWYIRTGPAPTIKLRILGADTLESLGGVPVYAYFVSESHINNHYNVDKGHLDIAGLKKKGFEIRRGNMTKFVQQKDSDIHEAVINVDVSIPVNLKRAKDKRVHEEKYRLIFSTVLPNTEYTYWTLSLPMVVITGTNQLCNCFASVMWQCFSTDVFTLPIKPLPVLPWKTVADMLQAKIRKISTRLLTEDDLLHLRHRLLSTSGTNTEIDINQFCSVPLPNNEYDKSEEFSFWKWFLSIYNLIEKYLKTFWVNGWIEGFLSKEETERKLKSAKHQKQGLFLLRFSDWSLDSTQTKDAIYGKIATSVLVKNSRGVMEVAHVDRIGYDKLIKDSLQHILLTTQNQKRKNIYRYLYPKMEKCEKLIEEKFNVTEAPTGGGYLGVQNAFIADLERIGDELSKLDLKEQISMETDSDSDDEHEIDSQSVTDAKKPKMNLNSSSVLASRVQEKNGNSHCSADVTYDTSGHTMPGGQMLTKDASVLRHMLTNPTLEHDYAQVYASQGLSNINALNKSETVAVERSVVSAQSSCNATKLLPTVIDDVASIDNVTKTTPLNPVTQNQNAADSGLNTTKNIIAQTSSGWVRINECKSDVNSAYDHNNEAVLGTFYGEKRVFDMLDFDTCQKGECAIENQVSNQAPDANHQAYTKAMKSIQADQQSFDNARIEQNQMEIAYSNNSNQTPGSFTNHTLVSDEMILDDRKNNESIDAYFNNVNLDDILSQTMNSQRDIHTQTETPPETPQINTDHFEGPIQDAKMMNFVRSFLESCPNEKLAQILPKNFITQIITSNTFFQQLTNIEYLTPIIENLPEDKRKRVVLALQSEKKNESRP